MGWDYFMNILLMIVESIFPASITAFYSHCYLYATSCCPLILMQCNILWQDSLLNGGDFSTSSPAKDTVKAIIKFNKVPTIKDLLDHCAH